MIFVPLPFVVALLLSILLAVMLRNLDHWRGNQPFLALVALCAVQSTILGLRWGYGVTELRYVLPVLAACLPPLVLESFRSLVHRDQAETKWTRWLHLTPPLSILALLLLAPGLIDFALIALFVGYALAVLGLGRGGPDGLDEARFDGAVAAHRALFVAAASLLLSALVDLAVVTDFEWSKGANAALIVTNANLLELLLIGLTARVAARARAVPPAAPEAADHAALTAQDREILDRLDGLIIEQKLFRDDNLTLARLARRLGVPARTVSGAVNRLARKNVSQYINDHRIAEACRLLRETDISVTSAMFEAGFQTKSNFNREFKRVTALSPAAWREKHQQPIAAVARRPVVQTRTSNSNHQELTK
ncbi:AraC family transcriptional regulator [Mesorhizobium sp. CN2-181]|uniref:helix-turn-helix domain-containing protein n=1 Tax=Mesorhizobium yinganensis TaxID=3157707 RepID=UPI0032B813E5